MDKFNDPANGQEQRAMEISDKELETALQDFKNSIQAWSDAAYHRPRTLAAEVRHRSWRVALGWAMGCFLVAGTVSGGIFERNHRLELARTAAAQRSADLQRQLHDQQAAKQTDEGLLADVDTDVSREVPSALEPLAQMMNDDETK
ncbi:MAG: hypothetical protein ABSF17_16755 [Terracidiphilus sp.]|jgi:hypothetical protein